MLSFNPHVTLVVTNVDKWRSFIVIWKKRMKVSKMLRLAYSTTNVNAHGNIGQ